MLLPLQLLLPTQRALLLQLAPPLPLQLKLLHPLPAKLRSNHFVIREKAASGRLFHAWCTLSHLSCRTRP